MGSLQIGLLIGLYFVVLYVISWFTSRKADVDSFFNANKKSPWYLVAFGMVGTSLSGVTFISVPGEVGSSAFSYLQFVFGNFVGYWLIAALLLPLYYKLNLVSIYTFLGQRFGRVGYKTGALYFLVSKLIGASFRFYLVAIVLQVAFFEAMGIPFYLTVAVSMALIWVYTQKAGIKTIVWTDTLQTLFLVSAVVFTIYSTAKALGFNFQTLSSSIAGHPYSHIFNWDWKSGNNFYKQFFAGIFMTIAMVGLDQDMMQKNLTCKTQKEAQKNMLVFSVLFVATVFLFLCLGIMLYIFARENGIEVPARTDNLYPLIAIHELGLSVCIAFLLGIISAAYSSADSALAAMTTSFCIDFLGFGKNTGRKSTLARKLVHLAFSGLIVLIVVLFHEINNESVVRAVFKVAGLTYGPILGLFAFGLMSSRNVKDKFIPLVALAAPVLSWLISEFSEKILWGYQFGFEVLIVNGALVVLGLWLISEKNGS